MKSVGTTAQGWDVTAQGWMGCGVPAERSCSVSGLWCGLDRREFGGTETCGHEVFQTLLTLVTKLPAGKVLRSF